MMNSRDHNKQPDAIAATALKWNTIAESWHSWIPRMRAWYAPATDLMLDLARIEQGDRVLDIAAGDCDQSLVAARRVGPGGYVLAIDVAEKLLEIGKRKARKAGLQNIATRVMDGGNLDLPDQSFDAVICRFALMYLPDPIKGLGGINRVLRRNGRVSTVVYGVNGSPEFSLAVSTVRKHLGLPAKKSEAHQLGDIGVLKKVFKKGGFIDIETHELDLAIDLASAEECVQYLQATSPTLQELTASLSLSETQKVWDDVRHALNVFASEKDFTLIHKVVVASGSAV